ncbi:hypothetical protein KC342_g72 [Hortaea werneckii]|nr:hypothetical protein KC342_g72 [Hortaea werneckii]
MILPRYLSAILPRRTVMTSLVTKTLIGPAFETFHWFQEATRLYPRAPLACILQMLDKKPASSPSGIFLIDLRVYSTNITTPTVCTT